MIEEIKNLKSTRKELSKFGYLMGTIFLSTGIYFLIKGNIVGYEFFAVGITTFIIANLYPGLLYTSFKIWMTFSVVVGWVMTKLILGVFFILIICSISVVARIFGKKFLDDDIQYNASTYWNKHVNNGGGFEKQF